MKYPEYIEELLPLSHFEGLVEQSIERFNEENAEHGIEPNQPQEVENSEILFFNEINAVERAWKAIRNG